ncbi:MAG: hypothetical protein RMY62_011070 [Nostoc sp. ZfuVER08]|nr:hypothetical protein [Nostoc sp. ZfuVER08]
MRELLKKESKLGFEKVKADFTCGKHQNEKVKRYFEKVKADFTCGKHQNEKANWGLRKSKLILLAENTKMRK